MKKIAPIVSWAFYDWANSAFTMVVMTAFFPVLLKQLWTSDLSVTQSTAALAYANSAMGVLIVLISPVLGAIADQGSMRKKFLIFFSVFGMIMTAAMYFVPPQQWYWAVTLYVLAGVGFLGGNTFYDALLMTVSGTAKQRDFVSSLGYGLGYLGGGVIFALSLYVVQNPVKFGFSDAMAVMQWSFLGVALWWLIFSLPLFFWVKEPPVTRRPWRELSMAGYKQLRQTIRELKSLRVVWLFLIAYFLYIDGVNTFILMSIDYGMSLGFNTQQLLLALLLVQFIGFPAAIIFGLISMPLGVKNTLYFCIVVYMAVNVGAYFIQNETHFYILAATIGLAQGAIQALSRSLYARLIPAEKSGEFFGFFNMLGKFATIFGTLLVALLNQITADSRLAILGLIPLFILGFVVLYFVDVKKGQALVEPSSNRQM